MAKREKLSGAFGILAKDIRSNQDQIKENIVIMPLLKALIPPLTQEEKEQLEKNILSEGIREALIVWENPQKEGNYILLDGHNRYEIAQKYGLDFKVQEIRTDIGDIEAAKNWMIFNQLGKRNLTENQKSYLRGKQYEAEKNSHGGERKASVQNEHLKKQIQNTRERLAEIHKVSPSTINRDKLYTEQVDKLAGDDSELRWKILNKDINISKKSLYLLLADEFLINEFRKYVKSNVFESLNIEQFIQDAQFAKAIDKIGEVNPALRKEILSGATRINKSQIQEIAKMDALPHLENIQDLENIFIPKTEKATDELKVKKDFLIKCIKNSNDLMTLEQIEKIFLDLAKKS